MYLSAFGGSRAEGVSENTVRHSHPQPGHSFTYWVSLIETKRSGFRQCGHFIFSSPFVSLPGAPGSSFPLRGYTAFFPLEIFVPDVPEDQSFPMRFLGAGNMAATGEAVR